jgi:hypothetical protein
LDQQAYRSALRAKLAYLVCTEELLNSRARSVPEMRLIATLSAFVEWSHPSRELSSWR